MLAYVSAWRLRKSLNAMIYVGGVYFLSGIGFMIVNDKLNLGIEHSHPTLTFFYFMSWLSIGIVTAIIVLTERFWNKASNHHMERLQ